MSPVPPATRPGNANRIFWPTTALKSLLAAWCLWQLALLAVLAWSLPVFHHTDEIQHYQYALSMRRGEARTLDRNVDAEVLQAGRLECARTALYFHPRDKATTAPCAENGPLWAYENYQPPLYYALAGLLTGQPASPERHLHSVRMIRLAHVAAFAAGNFVWALALSRLLALPRLLPLLLACLMAWSPNCLFRVSNDISVHVVSGLILLACVSRGVGGWTRTTLVGAALAAGVLSKYNVVYAMLPPILGWLLWRTLSNHHNSHRWPTLPHFAVLLAVVALTGGLLAADNYQRFGSLTGSAKVRDVHAFAEVQPLTWMLEGRNLMRVMTTLVFGETVWHGARLSVWPQHDPPTVWLFWSIGVGLLGSLVWAARAARRKSRRWTGHALPALAVLWIFAIHGIVMSLVPGIWFHQGRLYLPALPLMLAGCVAGLAHLTGHFPKLGGWRVIPALFCAGWIVHNGRHLAIAVLRILEWPGVEP